MKILVALSGGIDSSVVAHLLKEQGHELVGARFLLWNDPLAPAMAEILPSKCCNAQTAFRARTVCETLGIPLHIVDLREEFKRTVVDPFLAAYARGETPNPCIGCNRTIKFGTLLRVMRDLGCERLASGHYARLAREKLTDGSERHLLLEAVDQPKDQSYYLYGLSQQQLRRCLFPLGTLRRQDVFALARHFGVPHDEHYRESQDLCFFPEKSPADFLRRHLHAQPGPIVRRDGRIVGRHAGLPFYTIGQRKGLGIGGLKIPLEIVAKDPEGNRLVVEDRGAERCATVALRELRFVSWVPAEGQRTRFEFRTRCHAPKVRGVLTYRGEGGSFHFDAPQRPQAPGQSLVLYRGEEVIGGGVIA